MSEPLPMIRGGLGAGFKRPTRRVTWPFPFDPSNPHRIVAGADTPPELAAYGILEAVLFYVTDKVSHLEDGYFFIGQSNSMDGGADDEALVMGQVAYPTPGDPTSATVNDVRTHLQFDLYGTLPGLMYTIFKDAIFQVNSSVAQMLISSPQIFTFGTKLAMSRTNSTDEMIGTAITGDTQERLEILASGRLDWGPGGSTARDTSLYRVSANRLKIENDLELVGQIIGPAWTSYTPTWSSSGTAPSLGNGSFSGSRWRLLFSDLYQVQIHLTMGSTTTYGTGVWFFSHPATVSSNWVQQSVGVAHFLDAAVKEGGGVVGCTSTTVIRVYSGHDGSNWGATFPFAWGNGDVCEINYFVGTS